MKLKWQSVSICEEIAETKDTTYKLRYCIDEVDPCVLIVLYKGSTTKIFGESFGHLKAIAERIEWK